MLVCLTVNTPAAPVGTAFSYSGRLQQSGSPASGLYDFQFSLWDDVSSGTLVGATQAVGGVTVSNGLFGVQLDFGPGPFNGSACWLEIDVRTNAGGAFTALSPRQRLLPVPYAIAASNLLGNLPAAQLSGTLPSTALAGYSGAVTFTNPGSSFVGTFIGNAGGLTNLVVTYSSIADKPLTDILLPGKARLFSTPPYTVNLWEEGGLPQSAATLSNVAASFVAWGLNTTNSPRYLNLDDGWLQYSDCGHDTNHYLVPDPTLFPNGVKPVADYLHSLGFKLGVYLLYVCQDYPEQEAQSLCNWGVDYIKFDALSSISYLERFIAIADSNYVAQGRSPMYINAHVNIYGDPTYYTSDWTTQSNNLPLLLNSQFCTGDIPIAFQTTMSGYLLDALPAYFTSYVPETAAMVATYNYPVTAATNACGFKTEMGVVSILSADLQLYDFGFTGGNPVKPSDATINAITNAAVLAIDRDPAQVVGWPVSATSSNQVWIRPLGTPAGPEWAVLIANLNATAGTTQTTYFSLTNLPQAGRLMLAVELWSNQTNIVAGGLWVTNYPCESKLFRFAPYSRGSQ